MPLSSCFGETVTSSIDGLATKKQLERATLPTAEAAITFKVLQQGSHRDRERV